MSEIFIDSLTYNTKTDNFIEEVDIENIMRYLKGKYTNKSRFKSRFVDTLIEGLRIHNLEGKIPYIQSLLLYYDYVKPFSYSEAFSLQNSFFKNLVFGTININEMMNELGNERISVEGKNVTHRVYKDDGSFVMRNYDVIYELYKVKINSLFNQQVSEDVYAYAIKCWCTTTEKEHWLWVETEYALKGPLEAIASTVRVYENMIPHIKTIKRQGDVLLFEFDKEILPEGNIVPLTAEQYFSKLIAQS